jgi:hypothetical protein
MKRQLEESQMEFNILPLNETVVQLKADALKDGSLSQRESENMTILATQKKRISWPVSKSSYSDSYKVLFS